MAISRVQQDDQANQSKWTPELWMQLLREFVAAMLGIVLLICTGYLALNLLASAENAQSIAAQKDILTVMTGLLGVVLGYYFGRTPADARAAQAQQQASAAEGRVAQAAGAAEGRVAQAQQQASAAEERVAQAQQQTNAKAHQLGQVHAKADEIAESVGKAMLPAAAAMDQAALQNVYARLREIVALSRS